MSGIDIGETFDYEAALREAVGRPKAPAPADTAEPEPAVTSPPEPTPAAEPERTPDGKFATRRSIGAYVPDAELDTSEPPAPEPEETPAPKAEPEGETLLAGKYKSSVELERAYKELEAKLGQPREDPRVHELQLQVARLEGRMSAQPQTPHALASVPPSSASDLIERDGAQAAAINALQAGNAPLYDAIMDEWFEDHPRQASRFEAQKAAFETAQELEARFAPTVEKAGTLDARSGFDSVFRETTSKLEGFTELEPEITEVMKAAPLVAQAIASGDPQQQQWGIETVYELAKSMKTNVELAKLEAERQAGVKDEKRAAQLVTGGQRPATPAGPQTREERMKRFTELMLAPPATSIEAGLEYPAKRD